MFDYCHLRHTRYNIQYNLAKRLCTIISDAEILDLKELQVLLLQRHYPKELILHGITKALSLDRKKFLRVKTQNMKNEKCHTRTFQRIIHKVGKFTT